MCRIFDAAVCGIYKLTVPETSFALYGAEPAIEQSGQTTASPGPKARPSKRTYHAGGEIGGVRIVGAKDHVVLGTDAVAYTCGLKEAELAMALSPAAVRKAIMSPGAGVRSEPEGAEPAAAAGASSSSSSSSSSSAASATAPPRPVHSVGGHDSLQTLLHSGPKATYTESMAEAQASVAQLPQARKAAAGTPVAGARPEPRTTGRAGTRGQVGGPETYDFTWYVPPSSAAPSSSSTNGTPAVRSAMGVLMDHESNIAASREAEAARKQVGGYSSTYLAPSGGGVSAVLHGEAELQPAPPADHAYPLAGSHDTTQALSYDPRSPLPARLKHVREQPLGGRNVVAATETYLEAAGTKGHPVAPPERAPARLKHMASTFNLG